MESNSTQLDPIQFNPIQFNPIPSKVRPGNSRRFRVLFPFDFGAESGLQGDLRSPGGAPLDRPIRVPLAAESCYVLLNYAPALPGEHVGMPQGDLETPGDERSTDDDPAVQPEHLGHELEVK